MGKCVIFCAAGFDGLLAPIGHDDFIIAADGRPVMVIAPRPPYFEEVLRKLEKMG